MTCRGFAREVLDGARDEPGGRRGPGAQRCPIKAAGWFFGESEFGKFRFCKVFVAFELFS